MDLETKFLLLVCLFGGLSVAAPWIAWRRLKALEAKFGRVLLVRGINGEQAAKIILLRGEIPQVDVDESHVLFADNYSPGEPAIKLSSQIYYGKRLFDVARAARRGHRALADAKLLDGHPAEEIEAAFLATRLDHLALPFTKTWMGVMFR
ncbi:MAG: hypothetical protein EBR62_06810 [Verrucomicrobia bacterium]|nr:hypothetical protein [Verrucomicrobiota bacterium]